MYFVMLRHPARLAVPMEDEDGEVAFFEALDDAHEKGQGNPLGENFGYDVFQLGNGE